MPNLLLPIFEPCFFEWCRECTNEKFSIHELFELLKCLSQTCQSIRKLMRGNSYIMSALGYYYISRQKPLLDGKPYFTKFCDPEISRMASSSYYRLHKIIPCAQLTLHFVYKELKFEGTETFLGDFTAFIIGKLGKLKILKGMAIVVAVGMYRGGSYTINADIYLSLNHDQAEAAFDTLVGYYSFKGSYCVAQTIL